MLSREDSFLYFKFISFLDTLLSLIGKKACKFLQILF